MAIEHSTVEGEAAAYSNKTENHFSGNVSYGTTQYGYPQYYFKSTYGEETANYLKKKKRGDLIPHQLFQQQEISFSSTRTKSVTYKGYDGEGSLINSWTSSFDGQPSFNLAIMAPPSSVTSRINDLTDRTDIYLQAAAGKLSTASFDALTFAAEAHKLRSQFSELVHRFKRLVTKVTFKRLASAWLEYRYAWRTLMYDIVAIDEALKALDTKRGNIISEHVGSDFNFVETETFSGGNFYLSNKEVKHTYTVNVGVRGSVSAKLAAALPKYSSNVSITAWELVKFSFIIDWFVTVGNYLESLQLSDVSEAYTASAGTFVQIDFKREVVSITPRSQPVGWPSTYISNVTDDESVIATSITSERIPTGIPVTPLWNLNLDPYKILDLVALMVR